MGTYLLQHCFQGVSGEAEDRFCNSWHFFVPPEIDDPLDFDEAQPILGGSRGDAISNAFHDFYAHLVNGNIMGEAVNAIGELYRIYRLADASPRVARWAFTNPTTAFPSPGGTPLPSEVALCLSFEAIAMPGTNRARRRGRVYLGPLTTGVFAAGSGAAIQRVDTAILAEITAAYTELRQAMEDLGYPLGIYSPTDNLFLEPARWWVDNAFDTQRRRGESPTLRSEVLA